MSSIEWTEQTWNPLGGCSPVSPGCLNCYAASQAYRFRSQFAKYEGTAEHRNGRAVYTGRINLDHAAVDQPRGWRKPRMIFVNSMSDLFHSEVPLAFIQRVFAVMNDTPRHTYQVLTKRPERVAAVRDKLSWTENIWLGTSVESDDYRERLDHLRKVPAAIRFVSAEPLLGPLVSADLGGVDWVIVGGESGPKARPCDPAWVRDIVARCRASKIAVFVKQMGRRPVGLTVHGKGNDLDDIPHDLRIREMPRIGRLRRAERRVS